MNDHTRLIVLLFIIMAALVAIHNLAFAQTPTPEKSTITDQRVDYIFNKQINFQATLQTDQTLQSAFIFLEEADNPHTLTYPVDVADQGNGTYNLIFTFDLSEQPLRAFSDIYYRFKVTLETGNTVQSEKQTLKYMDNRHNWWQLEENPFHVYWYEGSIPFAQSSLDAAQAGLLKMSSYIPVHASPDPVYIYIYPSSSEVQDTLVTTRQDWVAGHADPELGVIVVSLPAGPDQQVLIEQRIPHELAHILLYRAIGSNYSNLPIWLNEGLASLSELYRNPDYDILLDESYSAGKILPMESLCTEFPQDAPGALLAYAQSTAFSDFIYRSYGSSSLQALIAAYADGLDCHRGAQKAFGVSLTQVDKQWRQERFGENAAQKAWSQLLPWFALLAGVVVIPLIIIMRRLVQRTNE